MSTQKLLIGKWQIIKVSQFDNTFINREESAYIEFDSDGLGAFHFGSVYANIDYSVSEQEIAEFSFYGEEGKKEIFGEGWSKIDKEKLDGHLSFQEGKSSQFQAIKQVSGKHHYTSFFKRKKKNSILQKLNLFV